MNLSLNDLLAVIHLTMRFFRFADVFADVVPPLVPPGVLLVLNIGILVLASDIFTIADSNNLFRTSTLSRRYACFS